MTVTSRSNTPLGENRKELHESVQELDNLLKDLNNAQVCDEQSYTSRLNQQASFYTSSSSLNRTAALSRPQSASSPTPLRKLAASVPSSAQTGDERRLGAQIESETARLESELTPRDDDDGSQFKRGTFIKDVVEEEILVDHVLVPKQQQSDRKFITKSPDRQAGERARRQVAFSGEKQYLTPRHHQQQHSIGDDDDETETYDNTDQEDTDNDHHKYHASTQNQKIERNHSNSMQSLNSATSDLTDGSSILDPNKIVNCYTCGERVVGQVITALGRNYHREHFTCAHCHQELGTRNFYERDNLPYCERDYQQLFSPKCAACSEPILDKVTIALEQTFHPEHFVCAHCGCQFDADDGFHEKDGRPYCKDDFFNLFANKCTGCALPITANYITALGVQWHPECFVCDDCHCPFADGKFFDIDGLPYCEIHYHARRGSLCAVCREPIIGKCTTAMFRKFHPDHFKCTYCTLVLKKSFKEENDKPYCFECFDKLYS